MPLKSKTHAAKEEVQNSFFAFPFNFYQFYPISVIAGIRGPTTKLHWSRLDRWFSLSFGIFWSGWNFGPFQSLNGEFMDQKSGPTTSYGLRDSRNTSQRVCRSWFGPRIPMFRPWSGSVRGFKRFTGPGPLWSQILRFCLVLDRPVLVRRSLIMVRNLL